MWDETNISTAFDPANRRGEDIVNGQLLRALGVSPLAKRMDMLQEAAAVGSSNFQLKVPVVRLPGRGLDLALDLTYNSLLWHEDLWASKAIRFDIDRDWPAPGWSLGFGKLVLVRTEQGVTTVNDKYEAMLVDADGTRHPYTRVAGRDLGSDWVEVSARTADGSLIDYTFQYNPFTNPVKSAQARYPDGTVVDFGALAGATYADQRTVYPTRITDANGNYITIAYRSNEGPAIDTITDTLGRAVRFHYDLEGAGREFESLRRLAAITGPGLGGTTRTLVRLNYADMTLSSAFKDLKPDPPAGGPSH